MCRQDRTHTKQDCAECHFYISADYFPILPRDEQPLLHLNIPPHQQQYIVVTLCRKIFLNEINTPYREEIAKQIFPANVSPCELFKKRTENTQLENRQGWI